MIEIKFYEKHGRFSIVAKGHAEYAPHGQDIVCAAVTSICTALGNFLENHEDECSYRVLNVTLEPGDIVVDAIEEEDFSYCMIKPLFNQAQEFLEDLAVSYPANVKIVP